jgi:hypothetical protein
MLLREHLPPEAEEHKEKCESKRWGAFGRFDLGRDNRQRARASGCCGHRGHLGHVGVEFVAIAGVRPAARARALLNTVGSCIDPPREAKPSPVVAPRGWATVNVLTSSRFRWCRAALAVVRIAGAVARVSIWRGLICGAV